MFSKMIFGDDLSTWALFVELILAGAVVILSGAPFSKRADMLADRFGLSGGWVGLVLLATATSLPELVTSATGTAIGNVDLAMGGILGSCCFNITIIVMLNAIIGGGSILRGVSASHMLTSCFGLILIGVALMWVTLADKFAGRPAAAQGAELVCTVVIVAVYLGGMRLIHRFEHNNKTETAPQTAPVGTPVALYVQLVVLALILATSAWWLANIGDVLSTHEIKALGRPLGATFVGAVFLAFATSLPEIVTSVTAVRLGNLNMALGNILGSNMFNILAIPFMKVVSLSMGQPLLMAPGSCNGTQNLITGLLAILLTAIAVGGLIYQSKRKMLRRFGFDSVLIALTYVGGMVLLLMDVG